MTTSRPGASATAGTPGAAEGAVETAGTTGAHTAGAVR